MIKANYDLETGVIKGFYAPDISYAEIPEPCIEITNEQHQLLLANQGKYIVQDGIIVDAPPISLKDYKQLKVASVTDLHKKYLLSPKVIGKYNFVCNLDNATFVTDLSAFISYCISVNKLVDIDFRDGANNRHKDMTIEDLKEISIIAGDLKNESFIKKWDWQEDILENSIDTIEKVDEIFKTVIF